MLRLPTRGIDELCNTAALGHIEEAIELIEYDNVNVNAYHSTYDAPPIAFAAQNGHLEMVKLLVAYEANIFYCEQDSKKKHLFIWALHAKNPQVIINYLQERGLRFDPNGTYNRSNHSPGEYLECPYPFLREIAMSKHWDFLCLILKNNLAEINIDLLYDSPSKNNCSIIESICDAEYTYNPMQKNIFAYLLLSYILKSKANNFTKFQEELENFQKKIVNKQKFQAQLVNNFLYKQILLFTQLQDNLKKFFSIQEFFFEKNKFEDIPEEIWLKIAKEVLAYYLPEMKDIDAQSLIEIFSRFNPPENKFNKLAKLAFREWRLSHSNFLLFNKIKKRDVLDMNFYDCLEECFNEKLSQMDLPFALRNKIITKISELKFEELNKPGIQNAIAHALKM